MMKNKSQIRGVKSFVPALGRLAHNRAEWLRFAVIAVLAMLALLVTQAITYSSIADVPAQHDLYAVVGLFLGYGLFITSRPAITRPNAATVFYMKERDL